MFQLILVFIAGGALGAVVSILAMMRRQMVLERENATLQSKITAGQDALQQAQDVLDARFKVTAQEALAKSAEQFMQLAQEKLKHAQADTSHDLEKRQKAIDEMIKPVHQNLEALGKALEQVKGTDQALREDLNTLNRETARLVGALRDPAAQGRWGEFILEGLLEKSGLMKGVHYKTQVSMTNVEGKRHQPDAIIEMQDGFKIVVDSKAPINEFTQRLNQNMSEDEYNSVVKSIAKQVRDRVKELGRKGYWEGLDSPDFTVMFLPSEYIYSIALRADADLVDYAAQQNVIIASPTLLISLLRVVSMSWRQVELAQNAQEISERGYDLYKRLLSFTGHIEKVGKNIGAALRGYNDAVGSLERSVLPAARRFKDLQGQGASGVELPEFNPQEETVRALSISEDDREEQAAGLKDVSNA